MQEAGDGWAGGTPEYTIDIQGQCAVGACNVAATEAGTGQRGKAWVVSPATDCITAVVRQGKSHCMESYFICNSLVCDCGAMSQLTAACMASVSLTLNQYEYAT